jgi:transcriptional regulator with XRE-family HTH domain
MNPAVIKHLVQKSGLARQRIADDAGLSYHALRSWLRGERVPQAESLAKLAEGLRFRGTTLLELADLVDGHIEHEEGG